MDNKIPLYQDIIRKISAKIEKSTSFKTVLKELEEKKRTFVKPSGRLFAEIVTVILQEKGHSPIVFILEDEDEMFYVREEIKNIFHKEVGMFYSFGEESTLNMAEIEDRLLTLDGILSNDMEFIVTNLNGLLFKVPPEREFKRKRIDFFKNLKIDFSSLIERLNNMGFNRVATVGEVGEYSVRGSIIDIYGYGMEIPRRIEFLGDKIVSLRSFDLFTQRTVKKEKRFALLPMIEDFAEGKRTFLDYISRNGLFIYPEFLFSKENHTGISYNPWFASGSIPFSKNGNEDFPDLSKKKQIVLSNDGLDFGVRKPQDFHGNLQLFGKYLGKIKDRKVFILCESVEETKRCEYLLEEKFPFLIFDTLNISEGIESDSLSIHIITDKEIFGKGFHPKRVKKETISFKPEDISELKPGDFVVHTDYGIGIFEKLGKIKHKGQLTECLLLRYKDGDILYVPINAMFKVSKYVGLDKGNPKLSNLSSMQWAIKKKNVKKSIENMTKELLRLYARRKLCHSFRFSPDTVWQKELEAIFSYEETKDQLKAIKDIKKDMESDRPMDRLVCGEVGYGKTEVAIRSAFKAVMESKQVLLLTPTTVLCEQHFNTFRNRMANFPIRIEMLSRFVKTSKQKKIVEDIKSGDVDIIIGTHKLLNDKIQFYDPGLLIIDEEHRFGVAQKEKIKKKKERIDVLSMSATPIPRTLQFSLLAIRDFSTIETPPKGRHSVITRIIHWNSKLIREVILSEFKRGGQVFFVHNRIEGLELIARKIEKILPEARIAVTHGRMKSRFIEERMRDFLSGRCNLLITTSIIESGLDIPNANTIIIDRADTYGLAQLHQLRGRVGRSNRKAYCYLIVPKRITTEARKRLSTIYTHSHLGSGLALAIKDLEIRGAGNLLGKRQHGHITKIGYDLYMKLLQETIKKLKGEKIPEKREVEIYSQLPAYLPEDYVEDEQARFAIYKKLSSCDNQKMVNEIEEELLDRFGALPKEVKTLLILVKIRICCSKKHIKKVSLNNNILELSFTENRYPTKKNIERLFEKVDKKFFLDYSIGNFKLGYKTSYKKILSDLKKVLNFFK
mgnify:CR=1 FL=1